MHKVAHHVFVCTNQASGVGEQVGRDLKTGLQALRIRHALLLKAGPLGRVQPTGCLGNCDYCKRGPGAAVVVYPAGTWYGHVQPADVPELLREHLHHGRPVERLLIEE